MGNVFYIERILYVNIGSIQYRGEDIEQVLCPNGEDPWWYIKLKDKRVICTTEKVTFCFKEK